MEEIITLNQINHYYYNIWSNWSNVILLFQMVTYNFNFKKLLLLLRTEQIKDNKKQS